MITLLEAKQQLRVDEHWEGDDALISELILVASNIVLEYTGLTDEELTVSERSIARQAVRLIVDQYYNQPRDREPNIPFGAQAICNQIRRYNR